MVIIAFFLVLLASMSLAQDYYSASALFSTGEEDLFEEDAETLQNIEYHGYGHIYDSGNPLYPDSHSCYRRCDEYIRPPGKHIDSGNIGEKQMQVNNCSADCAFFSPCFYWCRKTYPYFTSSGHHRCAFQCTYDHYHNVKRYF